MTGTSTAVLMIVLGLRHGLDPDHIAVIDNLTFQASENRPRLAPWMGGLFATGHSISVTSIAVLASLFGIERHAPAWLPGLIDWAIIIMLFAIAGLNIRSLLRSDHYTPLGWRRAILPPTLRSTTHPLGALAIGMMFGLVFDTATQAAAWGAAAASTDGITGALTVAALFSGGMILTDVVDSNIVARLLRNAGDLRAAQRYRRIVGWIIVALSLGMGGYALATKLDVVAGLPALAYSIVGAVMAAVVLLALFAARREEVSRTA